MYKTTPCVHVAAYPDPWIKGRYRLELKAASTYDQSRLDRALRRMGYHAVDADQWGRTYGHRRNSKQTAQVDQLSAYTDRAQLVLCREDLAKVDIRDVKDEMALLYDRVREICQSGRREYVQPSSYCLNRAPDDAPGNEFDWCSNFEDTWRRLAGNPPEDRFFSFSGKKVSV